MNHKNASSPIIHPILKNRWSPIAFAETPVEPDKLTALFSAAQWAPSSRNEQPWRFLLGVKGQSDSYDKILEALNDKNRHWASTAPVLMISLARVQFTARERDNYYAMYDLGTAVGNLLAQATHFDLYAHQMGGYSKETARELFQIPDSFHMGAAIALGYLGTADRLGADLDEKDPSTRTRKPLSEVVFESQFGQSASLFT